MQLIDQVKADEFSLKKNILLSLLDLCPSDVWILFSDTGLLNLPVHFSHDVMLFPLEIKRSNSCSLYEPMRFGQFKHSIAEAQPAGLLLIIVYSGCMSSN